MSIKNSKYERNLLRKIVKVSLFCKEYLQKIQKKEQREQMIQGRKCDYSTRFYILHYDGSIWLKSGKANKRARIIDYIKGER